MAAYSCPGGLDCSFSNSCPSLSVVCPDGWFCGSYASSPLQSLIDAELVRANPLFVPRPDRWLEAECPSGFVCANTTSIALCPAGSWCAEGFSTPQPCDALSLCASPQTRYQLSLAAPLVALIYTLVLGGASLLLIVRQRAASAKCRQLQVKGTAGASEDDDGADCVTTADTAAAPAPNSNAGMAFSFEAFTLRKTGVSGSLGGIILNSVTCVVPASQVTAVLGPSGCGKSSLLSAMRGGARDGCVVTGGSVRATMRGGSVAVPANALGLAVGFVPQEDLLDRALTPRELLRFSAATRLPAGTSSEAIEAAVTSTLRDLGLEGTADVIVGGSMGTAANISGGQVKRVSIGIELVAGPDTLLLDEPTSGLDATTALVLLRRLRAVSLSRGVTIVCALAQPRAEAFSCADRIVLLQTGGRVAFVGASRDAVPHFAGILPGTVIDGLLPPGCNPADFLLDILDGRAPGSRNVDLSALWKSARPDLTGASPPASAQLTVGGGCFLARTLPSIPAQLLLQAQRALLFRVRDAASLRLFGALHVFMALTLSSGFSIFTRGSYEGTFVGPLHPVFAPFVPPALRAFATSGNVSDLGLQQLLFFIAIACGTASGMSSISSLGGLLPLFRREVGSGASLLALALGRMTAELVVVGFVGSVFCGTWMLFGHAGHWWNWLAVIVGTSFAAAGVGHFYSAALDSPTLAAAAVQITMIVTSVLAGVSPRLTQVLPYPVANWPWLLSFATYSSQGAYASWSQYQRPYRDVDLGARYFGYQVDGIGRAVGALFGIGLLWRLLALSMLAWRLHATAGLATVLGALFPGRPLPLRDADSSESEGGAVSVADSVALALRNGGGSPPAKRGNPVPPPALAALRLGGIAVAGSARSDRVKLAGTESPRPSPAASASPIR